MKKNNIRFSRRGFTLIEAMVVVVTLALLCIGVGTGLQSLVRTPKINDQSLAISNALLDQADYYRSLAFASITSTTNASFAVNGIVVGLTVTVSNADPTFGGATQTDFKKIVITIGGQSITTYMAQ